MEPGHVCSIVPRAQVVRSGVGGNAGDALRGWITESLGSWVRMLDLILVATRSHCFKQESD